MGAKILVEQQGFTPNDALACSEAHGDVPIGVQQIILAASMATFKSKNLNMPLKDAFMESLY